MAHDVFISYSSKDKPIADAVCAVLESEVIRCWIAPRDVGAGQDWGESILEGIKSARVMVLVLSTNANESPHIRREVERAVSLGLPIIPLRVENVVPAKSLELFISTSHWLDAFNPPLERHLRFLAQVVHKILLGPVKKSAAENPEVRPKPTLPPEFVQAVLEGSAVAATGSATAGTVSGAKPQKARRGFLVALVILSLLVAIGALVLPALNRGKPADNANAAGSPVDTNRPATGDQPVPAEAITAVLQPEQTNQPTNPSNQSVRHNFRAWPAYMAAHLGTNAVGGYCFVVRDHGKIAASGMGGYARMSWEKEGAGLRWTTDKTMWVGDSGFTTPAFLKLWEEKKFSLDEPFWPYVKNIFPYAHGTARFITLRNLMDHKSGLNGPCDTIQKAAALLAQPVKNPPGTVREYNDANVFLLGLVLERISGESYTQYVKTHLLAAVGATRTDTKVEAYQPVLGYDKDSTARKFPGFPFAWDSVEAVGARSWYTSPADWTAFMAGLGDGRILSNETIRMMFDEGAWGGTVKKDGQTIGYNQGSVWWWKASSRAGKMKFCAIHFTDGVDAVLFINSDQGDPTRLLTDAWRL